MTSTKICRQSEISINNKNKIDITVLYWRLSQSRSHCFGTVYTMKTYLGRDYRFSTKSTTDSPTTSFNSTIIITTEIIRFGF